MFLQLHQHLPQSLATHHLAEVMLYVMLVSVHVHMVISEIHTSVVGLNARPMVNVHLRVLVKEENVLIHARELAVLMLSAQSTIISRLVLAHRILSETRSLSVLKSFTKVGILQFYQLLYFFPYQMLVDSKKNC